MPEQSQQPDVFEPDYEYCPRCYANLTLQKGYSNTLPYWICTGCGEMLINPEVEGDIAWICDGCGEMLNIQPGFSEDCGIWKCTKCGYENPINERELYASEDEFQASLQDPYKGLTDAEVLELSCYQVEEDIDGRADISLVTHRESGEHFIRKLLTAYDKSIYDFLKSHPIAHMPRIIDIYESSNCLVVIEEYIGGRTVAALLEESASADEITTSGKPGLSEELSLYIAKKICVVLCDLHGLSTPIVHRDIKPSNIIVTPDNEVYLLDMNVAKWFDPDKTDDTRYMGTQYYAAPEQVGFGLSASSAKSDIYAMGMLLNVMLTGKFPKEERAPEKIWDIIERCISLKAEDRYTAMELMEALEEISKA